jgi:hypothetical protein
LALKVAPYFRLSQPKTKQIIKEIEQAVESWRTEAEKLNISKREIEQMSPAFLPYK